METMRSKVQRDSISEKATQRSSEHHVAGTFRHLVFLLLNRSRTERDGE
jgi:hypothetical protein